MNKQSKKGNISWTDYTWNPIKGLCPVGCWYCYSRKLYKRFKLNPEIRPDTVYYPGMMAMPSCPEKLARIFVCSTFEIFHPAVKKYWRDWIFDIIEYNNTCVFQILTKMPENIDRPMPDNVWLGISVGDELIKSAKRANSFIKYIRQNEGFYFLSVEPLIDTEMNLVSFQDIVAYFGWVIIGRLTGHGKKHDPSKSHIQWIVDNCQELQIPIFLKNNLKEIWGEKLIQEFPERERISE